jgi:hypothetical protein
LGAGSLTQPLAGLHESVVHGLPSSQLNGVPDWHVPPEHVSLTVQALPSSHEPAAGVLEQPVAGTQESAVHGFVSAQLTAAPVHWPDALQVSPDVQALASLHAAPTLGAALLTHPLVVLHESFVHVLLSLQFNAGPGTQFPLPPAQVSFAVQALLSVHAKVFGVLTHPVPALHESVVQTLLSLQFNAAPGTQAPPEHASFTVQALPSVHAAVLFAKTHPVETLHESFVQALESLHVTAVPPVQMPVALQVVLVVQAFESLQAVPVAVRVAQLAEQQSPAEVLPSSHCSPASTTPLPQTGMSRRRINLP